MKTFDSSALVALLLWLAFGSLLALPARGGQESWPQFRGPNGLAVSDAEVLPTTLDPASDALLWKTPIRGTGISSPAVHDGRVYVTSAYEGVERSRIQFASNAIIAGLALIALLAIVRRRRGADPEGTPSERSGFQRLVGGLDTLAVTLATLAFLAGCLAVAFQPDRFYAAGIPGDAWLVTGAVASIGVVAAVGQFHTRSVARLLGALAIGASGWFILDNLPLNKHHAVYSSTYRAALVAPSILGAVWYLAAFALAGGRPTGSFLARALAALALLGMAGTLFVRSNVLSPNAGLARSITCIDLATGEERWEVPLFVAPEERLHRQNSFATPTPCVAGDRVLAWFGPGYACLDLDGKVLWEGRDDTYIEYSHYGAVSSPIAFEDTFIVLLATEEQTQSEYNRKPRLMAFDQESGDVVWSVEPPKAHDCYMTPLLMPRGDDVQLVAVNFASMAGYDPRSGKELWEIDLATHQHVPSLCYQDDLVLVAGGAHEKWITAGVRVGASGDVLEPEVLWKSRRAVPSSASPVLYDGLFFTCDLNGIMVCFDPMTGKTHWRERINGTVTSSLVGGGGNVYVCTEEGEVIVVKASPEFEVVERSDLGEKIASTPAIVDGRILVRGERHLFYFEGS
ncbi:MAG: PQQ-binding-like beta-propeller repeat protein [Planctomycetota bacterium]